MILQQTLKGALLFQKEAFQNILLLLSMQSAFMNCLTIALKTTTTAAEYDQQTSPDADVALEGSCVAVCDAMTMSSAVPQRSVNSPISRTSPKRLAFSVLKRDNNIYIDYNQQKVIMFDHLLLNIGNSYDFSKSTFTAKYSGVYKFQFTIFKILSKTPVSIALTVSRILFFYFVDRMNKGIAISQLLFFDHVNQDVGMIKKEKIYGSRSCDNSKHDLLHHKRERTFWKTKRASAGVVP